jgi:formylglycine-generating enzyme required for sulfatase activity
MMGSSDAERSRDASEGPQHLVALANDFYLGTYELTQAQWAALMGGPPAAGYGTDPVGDNYPVHSVTWAEAQDFVAALNTHITTTSQGPLTVRLPSEAEWEYACRGGTQTRFFFGDSLDVGDTIEDDGVRSVFMWYGGNNVDPALGQKPVGTRLPNPFGLFDMHGNVSEWCADAWHADYTGAPADGSVWDEVAPTHRAFRGGWWGFQARFCRSASRFGGSNYGNGLGFRLAAW